MQAKELRLALEKENISYSRDRLNDLLNLMMDSADIERIVLDNQPYPVYSILKKSKISAEYNGTQFGLGFRYSMFHKKHLNNLIDEFQTNHKKTKLDAILEYFGFIVLGSLLSSRIYDNKEQRTEWLKPVLDLERNCGMSDVIEGIANENELVLMAKELIKKYPKNMSMLGDTTKFALDLKKLVDDNGKVFEKDKVLGKGKVWEKVLKSTLDNHKSTINETLIHNKIKNKGW